MSLPHRSPSPRKPALLPAWPLERGGLSQQRVLTPGVSPRYPGNPFSTEARGTGSQLQRRVQRRAEGGVPVTQARQLQQQEKLAPPTCGLSENMSNVLKNVLGDICRFKC